MKRLFLLALIVLLGQISTAQEAVFQINGFHYDTTYLNSIISKIRAKETKIPAIAALINSSCASEREKVYVIYGFIAGQFKYDMSRFEQILKGKIKREMYVSEVMLKRKGVCGDFSNLFKVLCDSTHVPCLRVSGYTNTFRILHPVRKKKYDHAWNVVKVNDHWYPVDVTWGMRQNTEKKYNREQIDWQFLLADPAVFGITHLPGDPVFQCLDQQKTYKTFRRVRFSRKYWIYETVEKDSILDAHFRLNERDRFIAEFEHGYAFEKRAFLTAISPVIRKMNDCTDKKNPENKKITTANYEAALEWDLALRSAVETKKGLKAKLLTKMTYGLESEYQVQMEKLNKGKKSK